MAYEDGKPVRLFNDHRQAGTYFSVVGYSNAAFVASFSWGCSLVMVILVVAVCAKSSIGLPLGGTNGAVISGACYIQHDERGDDDVTDRALK